MPPCLLDGEADCHRRIGTPGDGLLDARGLRNDEAAEQFTAERGFAVILAVESELSRSRPPVSLSHLPVNTTQGDRRSKVCVRLTTLYLKSDFTPGSKAPRTPPSAITNL